VTLSVAADVEILLIVLDASRSFGEEDRAVIESTLNFSGPRVIAYNKIDLSLGETNDSTLIKELNKNGLYDFYSISALTGMGTDKLVERLLSLSPMGELLYPADMYTDQSPEFRVAEIVRETAFENTFAEVPHSLFIEVIDLERHSSVLWTRVTIWVERSSQVGIVVGRRGVIITKIRQKAEAQLVNIFGCPVSLNLRVKVKKKWRNDDSLLQELHLQG
jgi:GTP-binding protein Era